MKKILIKLTVFFFIVFILVFAYFIEILILINSGLLIVLELLTSRFKANVFFEILFFILFFVTVFVFIYMLITHK